MIASDVSIFIKYEENKLAELSTNIWLSHVLTSTLADSKISRFDI